MRIEVWIFLAVVFFVVDWRNGHKYSKAIAHYKQYAKPAAVVFGILSMYLFAKKNPGQSAQIVGHFNQLIKHMPIDQSAKDLVTPFFSGAPTNEARILGSGQTTASEGATARSVSTTKKKYVAASQGWECGECKQKLDAWFEVDHRLRLADGGSNHVSNLVALCRNCHGKKTMFENM